MLILNDISCGMWRFVRDEYIIPIIDLVSPPRCPVCGGALISSDQYICTACRLDAPLTYLWREGNINPMAERVQNIRPEIRHASALIYYIHSSRWRNLIHRFKYKSEFRHGKRLGEWLGYELSESPLYRDIEFVVAVPLHPFRRLKRGYNQSETIADGVAKALRCSRVGGVKRLRHNASQASTQRRNRWRNVEGLFEVTNPALFEGRNVLLVDDVFTTGATIMSCAEAILDAAPTCQLSIATLAVSNHEFGVVKK